MGRKILNRKTLERNLTAIAGMLVFSMGINFFIVPADLYNGGLMGISQVIRTLLVQYVHLFSVFLSLYDDREKFFYENDYMCCKPDDIFKYSANSFSTGGR